MIEILIAQKLQELDALANKLNNVEFTQPCPALGGASIGEHMRHVIEMLQCLQFGHGTGRVDYDSRKRNPELQGDAAAASGAIRDLLLVCGLPNRDIQLLFCADGQTTVVRTNFHRELIYNLEHAVHHQAFIRVALRDLPHIEVNPDFGVARSTVEYRRQCAR